jgi:FAD/FMN-containing dehydrogenase
MLAKDVLESIVGTGKVLDNPEILEEYSRDLSFVHPIRPRCVVKPGSPDEVQALVKWANEARIPLVPVSSGGPHFRGDTVPSAGGAIIVDLSGMKQIIRIDTKNRVVMVEPGVTFGELIPVLEKEGLKLNMPLLPRGSKAVVGSALEREPVTMPKYHWDACDPLACTEVIYGTGDRFRTGSAAGPGDLDYQWESGAAQGSASGPAQVDFHRLIQGAQGTMGIVTWATIRCERMPRVQEPFLVGSQDLDGLLEFVHWLIRLKLVDECLVLNNVNLARISAKDWPNGYETIRDALPRWTLFFCTAGHEYFPEEKIDYQKETMMDLAKRLGLQTVKSISRISAFELLNVVRRPSEEPHWKLRGKGLCSDVLFVTTRDKLPELFNVMSQEAERQGYPTSDMGVYIQPIVQGTSCHCEFNLFFDPQNTVESDRVRSLSVSTPEILAARGAFFSRPYGPWADMVYRRDAQATIALRSIKGIFDPNNIMNSGKLCF